MSNRINGLNEVHITYQTDTSKYVPTYNTLTVISDVAYDNKSAVSVSFDLSGLVETNAAAGTSDKLESNEYSTVVGFTLNNTGSFRISGGEADAMIDNFARLGTPETLDVGTPISVSLNFNASDVLVDYSSVFVVDPVSDS